MQLAIASRVRFIWHKDGPPLIVDAITELTGLRIFALAGCHVVLGFLRPFYAAFGQHPQWQAISQALERCGATSMRRDPDLVAPSAHASTLFGSVRVSVVDGIIAQYRTSNTRTQQFPVLSQRDWPAIMPKQFLQIADNLGWEIALRQLQRYWALAQPLPEVEFPVRGWVKKYNRFLVSMADGRMDREGMRSGASLAEQTEPHDLESQGLSAEAK